MPLEHTPSKLSSGVDRCPFDFQRSVVRSSLGPLVLWSLGLLVSGAPRPWRLLGWMAICAASAGTAPAADSDLASRVVILANSDDPDSLRIARHYAEVRAVPPSNIIAFKMSLSET